MHKGLGRIAALAVVLMIMIAPAAAHGWAEGDSYYDGDPMDCAACHAEDFVFGTREGPHGYYTSTTGRCDICHSVHAGPSGGISLLPMSTIKDNCLFCHDGTGGYGVYGTITARGLGVGANHSVDATNAVPGGDAGTGGSAVVTFGGENDFLSCDDCHSPHASSVVATFSVSASGSMRAILAGSRTGVPTSCSSSARQARTPRQRCTALTGVLVATRGGRAAGRS
ncbi:MAG: hypothetical protein WBI63_06475 [Coriobacteriia bacterium]